MPISCRMLAAVAFCLIASGCTTLEGPKPTVDDNGPVRPNSYASPSVAVKIAKGGDPSLDADHPPPYYMTVKTGPVVPLYDLFVHAWWKSYLSPQDGPLALEMFKTGMSVTNQNCADYFESNGRLEHYLLFGQDVTTFLGSVSTAALTATKAPTGAIAGVALGTTNLLTGNALVRKQLTYGADFTDSTKAMVFGTLSVAAAAVGKKQVADYRYGLAIDDLRDYQGLCMPAAIAAHMSQAIAQHKFIAFDQGGKPLDSGNATPGKASAADKASAARQTLSDLYDSGDLRGDLTSLFAALDGVAKSGAVSPPGQMVPADARITVRAN